jgi:acyl-CoA thioesterase
MNYIKEFIKRDKFAEYVGIELLEVSEGSAKAKLICRPEHLNGANVVHGAAIFALADLVLAAAANSYGTVSLAISATISFLKAVTGGTLFAEAKEISRDHKLGTYQVAVTDEKGNMVAAFQGTAYRKKDRLPL